MKSIHHVAVLRFTASTYLQLSSVLRVSPAFVIDTLATFVAFRISNHEAQKYCRSFVNPEPLC